MFPEIAQKITIFEVVDTENNGSDSDIDSLEYTSRVVDMTDKHIHLELPKSSDDNRVVHLSVGAQVLISYTGKDNCKREFISQITEHITEPIAFIKIQMPDKDNVRRIQRRNYVRVLANLKMYVRIIRQKKELGFMGITLDISGGGAMIAYNRSIELMADEVVKCSIDIPVFGSEFDEKQQVNFQGRVIRIVDPQNKENYKKASLEFSKIDDIYREMIVRYCFERQVAIKRNSVIPKSK